MSSLSGKDINATFKSLLRAGTDADGIEATLVTVCDGGGTNTPLQLSNSQVNIISGLLINGVGVSALGATLNQYLQYTGSGFEPVDLNVDGILIGGETF